MKKFYQVRGWCVRYLCCLSFISLSLQTNAQQVPKSIPAGAPVHNLAGYYESLPADYATTTKKYPVIIFAHGVGELAGENMTTPLSAVLRNGPPRLINENKFPASFTSNGQTFSFIVISPQFKTWPGGNDVHELLAYLKTIYRIDESRVYMTGLSMGGGVSWGVISENTDKAKQFAAAVVVCGAWNPNDAPRTPSLQANIASINMPVFAFHNDRDPTVPLKYSQDWVNGINAISPAPNPKALLTIFSSTSHDAWSKTFDPNYKDPQTGMNVYEWMLQYTRGTVVQPPPPPPPGNKRITVNPSSANIIYYDNAMTQLGVTAGDTLCIPPGDYEYIHFGKLTGTEAKPIIITNCNGLVRAGVNSSATAASFVLSTCKYFKVEGNGAAGIEYGFDINGTNKNGMKMFGMFFGNGTTDFEVHHAYIHDAGMFLQAKTLQTCDHPEWLDGNFTMKNVKIHDLMCRNSAWEGFYIGNTHYLYTNGGCTDMKSHLIENLSVYNNNLENMGSDGIQISTAYKGDNKVYNNRVVNYAMARNSAHGYGILSGGGSSLRIYSNYVSKGYNSGIEIFGSGINYVYNNVVTDVHYEGINVADKPLFDPATAYIYNNTVYNTGVNGIKVYGYGTLLGHKVYNNVVVAPGTQWDDPMTGYYIKGAQPILYDFKNNLNYKTIDEGGFVNPLAGDFRLKAGSTAIDAGRNMADLSLTTDFDGNARPVNNSFDAGAFEFNGSAGALLPVANAGADKLLVPADNKTTTLDGSASSKDGGSIATYAWKKISGPAATIASPGGATTQLTGLAIGSYVFELTVTDNAGLSAKDLVTVTVLAAANKPPVSDIGSNATLVLPSNSTQLTGSMSIDPDGVIVSYLWKQVSGPVSGTMDDNTACNAIVSGLGEGVYVYELTVTDNGGLTNSKQVTVTVVGVGANKPPVANAGADVSITLPANTAQLDGSASSDPDGTIATYTWTKISGPDAGVITTGSANKTTITGLTIAGDYVYELSVKDNSGTSATDQVKVTVIAVANKPPVANAGADVSITMPANTAQLDGSASSDPDGTIATYTWTQVSGPVTATITTPAANKTTITGLTTAGEYVYELSVKDNGNTTAVDQVKVTVSGAANKPPVANAGADITITLPTSTAQLDGSASSDPDGTIATYTWTQVSGPATGSIATPAANKTTITGLTIAGEYVYDLSVKDNAGTTVTDQVKIIVVAGNKPPIANAGADVTVTLPANTAQLDGSGSSDPDGTITTYTWTKVSGPATGSITTPAANKTTITGLTIAGEYVYELSVKDNGGTTVTDQVKVVVIVGGTNQPPVARAGFNTSITLPVSSVELDGSGSSDPDGTIASYAWKKLGGPASGAITTANAGKTTVTGYTLDGTYVYELTVTDNQGLSTSSNVTITVNAAANQPPVARANGDITITLPVSSVQLDASASTDADGTIATYLWNKVSGPAAGSITTTTASKTSVTGLTLTGDYLYQITVKDNAGAVAAVYVKVTVLPGINKPPTANAGGDVSITLPTNTAQLDGSASSDPDGTITTYAWTKVSGPAGGSITTPAANKTTVTGLTIAGEYVYQLSVKDNTGATVTDQVKVIVVAGGANQPPVARAGFNTSITLPVNSIQLDGSTSSDPDGTIASYSWRKLGGPASGNITVTNASKTSVTGYTLDGVYVYELTVTDNLGLSSSSNVTITVNAAVVNKPPVAQTSGDVNITLPTTSATVDGSASVDLDGSIVSYAWKQLTGPVTGTIASPTAAKTNITNLTVAGQYVYELTVKDNSNATNTAQVKVIVNTPANKLPTARVNGNLTLILPTSNTLLDGATSSDEDGTVTSYYWRQISGPVTGAIATPNGVNTAITGLTTEGAYVFELTVTDNSNTTGSARVTVSVLPAQTPDNKLPVAITQGDLEIKLPDNLVNVSGRNSYDSDGTIVAYEWTQLTGPNNSLIWDAQKAQTAITGLLNGEYLFQLAVTDDRGGKTLTTFKVTVLDENNSNKADTVGMYPNPAHDFTKLVIFRKGTYKINIQIYDMTGKLWKEMSTNFIDKLQEDLPLKGLPRGYYIIHITGTPNFKWTGKLLKVGN